MAIAFAMFLGKDNVFLFQRCCAKVVVLGVTVDKKYSRSDTDRRRHVREGL